MTLRMYLWLWALGIALAVVTGAVFIWQLKLGFFTGLIFVLFALWMLLGSAIAVGHYLYALATKLHALTLVPALLIAITTQQVDALHGNLLGGCMLAVFVLGIALFCWAGDRESDEKKLNAPPPAREATA